MFEPGTPSVQREERDGRYFIIVSEDGQMKRHGPLTKQAADELFNREYARLTAKPRP